MLLWTNTFYESLSTRLINLGESVMLTTANRHENEDNFYLFLTVTPGSLEGF